MKILVLGAGTIGICTAWHLLELGHEVTVVERQPDAAMETSFANGAQISVSYCEPWANKQAPLKALKWMLSKEAPLLFRPQNPFGPGVHQYTWGLQFLANCNDAALKKERENKVLDAKHDVSRRQADLDKAMKKGDADKINKRKDKLAESRKALQDAVEELDQ